MGEPFQFSMRRMFALFTAMALFCSALSLFLNADRYYQEVVMENGSGRLIFEGMRAAGVTAIAAGIGLIVRRPFLCVAVVLIVYIVRSMVPDVY